MRQFFVIVFGGITLVFTGIILSWGMRMVYDTVSPHLSFEKIHLPSFASVIESVKSSDVSGTTVSGMSRIIRYSAQEEEDTGKTVSNPNTTPTEKITASGYIVKDLTTNTIIEQHNADTLLSIASLSKLVTAVVARRLISVDARIEITRDIVNTYGNTAGFKSGEIFSASDLLYPLLMVSSNDAAEAFARTYGRKAFIESMNDFAQSIGAYRTYFRDPSGLSDQNQSTASDIALIVDWIRTHDPQIIEITTIKDKTVRSHTWENPAHFLSLSNYLGGKNGFTTKAKKTSVSLFTLGPSKHIYAVVLLGSANRDADVMNLLKKVN